MLEKMSKSLNKDLFRTECTIILEYKWNQLKRSVYIYNAFLILYVAILVGIQVNTALYKSMRGELNVIALILTILVSLPELYQNVLSINKICQDKTITYEDFQNFYEFLGYFLQILYLLISIM